MSSSENNPRPPEEQLTPAQKRQRERMKIFSALNVIFVVYIVAFLFALIFVRERLLILGAIVADIAAFLLLNGGWLLFTRDPSFFFKRGQNRKLRGLILFLCGIIIGVCAVYILIQVF